MRLLDRTGPVPTHVERKIANANVAFLTTMMQKYQVLIDKMQVQVQHDADILFTLDKTQAAMEEELFRRSQNKGDNVVPFIPVPTE